MDNKTTAMTDNTLTVEALEDEIRRHVEWWYSADRLASDLAPFINRHIADRVAELKQTLVAIERENIEGWKQATYWREKCEAAGRADTVPAGWRESVTRAMDRARVFDDGTDGADAESARSVVAILSGLLAHIPQQATAQGKGEDTLASLIASAIRMDENGAGCDLPAGIFGPHMTRLIHDLAARHHCEPAGSETVAYTVTHVQGCTVVGYFLLEVETDNPPKTGDILYTHPSPVVDAEALASEVGEVVEFQDGTREWTFQSDTLIAFARRLTGSKSDA